METVFIDGSEGEGGGQILRTSLTLSCITGRGLHIENIRAGRPRPGLAKQHISCVQAACRISNGQCKGAEQGSKVLDFQPGGAGSGDFYFDIGSAGAASLVMQTVLPVLFLGDKPSAVTIAGGTHNPLAPPFDFVSETFLPAIRMGGFRCECELLRYGFYPAGGGKIVFKVRPRQKNPEQIINLCEPCRQLQIYGRIYTARLSANIPRRQQQLLRQSRLAIGDIESIEVKDSDGPGNCVMIRACGGGRTAVFTAFGMRGRPSEDVVNEVVGLAEDFIAGGAAVDSFLADQILVYMAIAGDGCFTTNRFSAHLATNMGVIKKFLPVDFRIEQQGGVHKVSLRDYLKK
jgi:RNA 3'-terminal phosphate cyclase (ATP)